MARGHARPVGDRAADRTRRGARLLRTVLSLLAVAAGTSAVGAGVYRAERHPQPAAAQSPAARGQSLSASPAPADTAGFTAALTSYLDGTGVRVSVLAVDDRTGASIGYRTGQTYQTASIVKVDILATLLLRAGDRELTDDERTLVDEMITESDNDAATALWDEVGGGDALDATDQRLGLTDTEPGDGDYWGETTTTVTDQVRLLDEVLDPDGPLGPSGAALVASEMSSVEGDQGWGVSAAATTGETTELKNGWMTGGDFGDDTWTINSIGRIVGTGSLTVAILSDGEPSETTGIATVEHIATLAREYLPTGSN
jgi:hypothetical protein